MIQTFSTFVLLIGALPGIAVGALIMWAIGRNAKARATGQPLPYPMHFNVSEFGKAVAAAFTGNIDAMKMAFDKSVDIQFKTGDRLAWMMDAVIDEFVARSKNPSAVMPCFDAVVQWSGIPRDTLVAMVEHELRSRKADPLPSSPPAVAAPAAAAVVLLLCSLAQGASPMAYVGPSHWHADVQAPQSFRPTEPLLFSELKPAVNAEIADQRGNVNQQKVAESFPFAPDGSRVYQINYQQPTQLGFWERGRFRRFVSAPFRWRSFRRCG